MKLNVLIPVHGRYAVTKFCLNSLIRHKADLLGRYGLDLEIIIGGDDPMYKTFAAYNKITYLQIKNKPLGAKFNKLINAGSQTADYIIWLNSDDIVSKEYWFFIAENILLNRNAVFLDRILITNIYDLDIRDVRLTTGFAGTGWLLSSKLIQQAQKHNPLFAEDKNKELDTAAIKRLIYANGNFYRRFPRIKTPLLMDIKSLDSMTPFIENYKMFSKWNVEELSGDYSPIDIESLKALNLQLKHNV